MPFASGAVGHGTRGQTSDQRLRAHQYSIGFVRRRAADIDEAAAETARKDAEDALANQQGEVDYGRASAQLAEATAQLAALRRLKNRAARG